MKQTEEDMKFLYNFKHLSQRQLIRYLNQIYFIIISVY